MNILYSYFSKGIEYLAKKKKKFKYVKMYVLHRQPLMPIYTLLQYSCNITSRMCNIYVIKS